MSETEQTYDLRELRVLHTEHPLQNEPNEVSTSVVFGLDWADDRGEGQGVFLCPCTKPCRDPELCGKTFFEDIEDWPRDSSGRQVLVEMPWTDGEGKPVVFSIWCCDSCEVFGTGSVYDTWIGRFYDLPARLLQYADDGRCRSYGGLKRVMTKRYPMFSETSFVTLVMYRRAS